MWALSVGYSEASCLIATAILLYLPPLCESLYVTHESPGTLPQYLWRRVLRCWRRLQIVKTLEHFQFHLAFYGRGGFLLTSLPIRKVGGRVLALCVEACEGGGGCLRFRDGRWAHFGVVTASVRSSCCSRPSESFLVLSVGSVAQQLSTAGTSVLFVSQVCKIP
jgi:hypothetical protein